MIDEWITKVGVGKIEWERRWEQYRVKGTNKMHMRYSFSLKLTARIGGQYVTHTGITLEDHRLKAYPPELLDEITAAYAEFLLKQQR